MESAVMERPMEVPDFDDAEYARQMGAAGVPETEAAGDREPPGASLTQALGLPEPYEDLWPGYYYKPPKLKELETIIPLSDKMTDLYNEGKVWPAVECAVELVAMLACKPIGGGKFREVSREEVLAQFDEDEIALVIDHMMRRQGIKTENPEGNAPGGGWTGLKNFQPSAASSKSLPVNGATLPSPSTSDSEGL